MRTNTSPTTQYDLETDTGRRDYLADVTYFITPRALIAAGFTADSRFGRMDYTSPERTIRVTFDDITVKVTVLNAIGWILADASLNNLPPQAVAALIGTLASR